MVDARSLRRIVLGIIVQMDVIGMVLAVLMVVLVEISVMLVHVVHLLVEDSKIIRGVMATV